MKCQYCNCIDSKVIDSRPTEEGSSIRRRREPFDGQKIKAGIVHACEKLPVSMSQIEGMCSRIEQAAYATMDGEIASQRIGDMVMQELKGVNDVAYVRFAAVYRLFTDIGDFMQELQKLLEEKK